jgi:sec-independent protein translocase protein TatB
MNLGITEMFFLFVLGLLLFGPKKLPEIGRQLGKALAEFKRASNEFQAQLHEEVRKLEQSEAEKSIAPPAGTAPRSDRQDTYHEGETPIPEVTPPTEPQNG